MPYRNPEDRRANWHKNRERNVARLRESYAKHREKRLAEKREEWARDPEKMRARKRESYAKHRVERVERARRYRRENAEEVNARAAARYHENQDAMKERARGYRERNGEKIYAGIKRWKKENPDREFLYHAKRLLNEATGIAIRDIPDDLAEAKAEQIRLHRLLRDSGSDRDGGDPSGAPCEASQSGGAEGAASPTLSSRNPETPNDR